MNSKSIARNTALMTLASVAQKVISFVYFTIVARNIGPENTGKYFFALSFTTIFVVLVDLGLTNVFIRESAREPKDAKKYLQTVLSAKIVLGVLTYLSAIVVINLLGYAVETRHLVYLSALTMLFDSAHMTVYGAMRAFGSLRYEAYGIILSQFATMVLGTVFIYMKLPLIYLILAYTIPSALNFCYATYNLHKHFGIRLGIAFDKRILKLFFLMAWPFALGSIFARVYSYADSIMLSKLAGNTAVGLYSIPYKITYAFQFIPLALTAVIYPRFSEYFASDRDKLGKIASQSIKYLLLIVAPIVVGISVLGRDIIFSLYTSSYADSILPLRILLVGLIFSFISFPLASLLNAVNRQGTQTGIMAIVMVVNLIFNAVLIPKFDIVGAAVSALVGNILLATFGFMIACRVTILPWGEIFKNFVLFILAGVIMGVVVFCTVQYFHYLVAVLVGVIVYPLSVFALRLVTVADCRELYHDITQKNKQTL
ncbi:MAG TPA: flippase [Candidatus Magasanikbacteria bacterium]|nr:flippase [Candidatus Magasanikbacteria bacterium]